MADTTLQSFSKKVDETLIDPLRRTLVGRRLVPVTPPAGFGVSAVEWSKITEMSAGMVSYAFTDTSDSLTATPTTSKIPVYWKDYTMDRRAYEGYLVKGANIDTSAAQSAAYVAAYAEDEAIIKGVSRDGTAYEVDGLYEGAGNDYSVSSNFGTSGVATTALAGAYALLADDNVPVGEQIKYNMVLNNTSYMDLLAVRNANGIREMPEIKEMLNGGSIIASSVFGSTEGIVLPAAESLSAFVDFYLASDWKTEHGMDSEHPDTGDMMGRVYSAGILRIKHDVAICKLSALA
jgi:uncharacterized linocin/CFP29 family protein